MTTTSNTTLHTTLHIVSHIANHQLPDALLRTFNPDDTLLLTGNAVYLAFNSAQTLPENCSALLIDIEARGLSKQWPSTVSLVDYNGFVALTIHHKKSVSWA